jgi:type II secretory pathway component PulJ
MTAPPPCRIDGRRGFGLIEMLGLMVLFGVVLLMGVLLLAGALQTTRAVAVAHGRMRTGMALADQFRADVAAATETPDEAEGVEASATCLLLRSQGGLVVYRWTGGHLSRSEEALAQKTERMLPAGQQCIGVEFRRAGPQKRLITLRLTETGRRHTADRVTELSAALGGDQQ